MYSRTWTSQSRRGEGAREIGLDGIESNEVVRRRSDESVRDGGSPGAELEAPLEPLDRMPSAVCAGALTRRTGDGDRGMARKGGVGSGPAEAAGALKC